MAFSPTIGDVRSIVSDYVKSNKIETPFKHNLPGRKWMQHFLNDNNLSLKKATLIAKVCQIHLLCTNFMMLFVMYVCLLTSNLPHQSHDS